MSLLKNMDIKDWVTVIAVILSPLLAVQAQKMIETLREKRNRRIKIFKTLMSTRGERLSRDHVQALNMIDIEFYGRRFFGIRFQRRSEKAVTNAWKNYNDNLNSTSNYELVDWRQSLQPPIVARYIGQRPMHPFKPYEFLVVSDPNSVALSQRKVTYHVLAHALRNSLSNESNPILQNRCTGKRLLSVFHFLENLKHRSLIRTQ